MAITRATNLAGLGTVFDALTDGGGLSISGVSTFTDLNITRTNVTGVSTFTTEVDFTSGPVLIGTGTSTGTTLQPLQVSGGAYVSSYVAIGITALSNTNHILQGVGTTFALYNPNSTTSGASLVYFRNNDATEGTDATIRLDANGGTTTASTTISAISESLGGNSALSFGTRSGGGGVTEKVRITSTGAIGIGTTNPVVGSTLTVNGPVSVTGNGGITLDNRLGESAYGATNQPSIRWGTNGVTRITGYADGTALGYVAFLPGGIEGMRLIRTSTTQMRGVSVGIGTTLPLSGARFQVGPEDSSIFFINDIGSIGVGTISLPNSEKLKVCHAHAENYDPNLIFPKYVFGNTISHVNFKNNYTTLGLFGSVTSNAGGGAITGIREGGANNEGVLSLATSDAAGTNIERFRILHNGNIGIGTTTAASRLEVRHTGAEIARFYRSGADSGRIRLGSSRGSHGSPATLGLGDHAGIFTFDAHDGTSFIPAASIFATLNAAASTNNIQGRLSIFCNPGSDTDTSNEVIRITHAANVGIGTNNLSSISSNVANVTLGSRVSTTSGGIIYQTAPATTRAYHYFDNNRMIHQSTKRHAFFVNGSNLRMLINESGDTIIGTGATTDFSGYKFPLVVTTNNNSSPTDSSFGGLYSYNGATLNIAHIGGGSDNDASSATVLMINSSTIPYPFGGLVVVGGNSTSATNQRVSLYLVKGEVITTAGVAAVQNTTVTAVAGDTASTSVSISGSSLDSGTVCAVRIGFSAGSGTNQNFGFVVMGGYSIIRKSVRQA